MNNRLHQLRTFSTLQERATSRPDLDACQIGFPQNRFRSLRNRLVLKLGSP